MHFPFDVLFLDIQGRVLYLISEMPPNRVSRIVAGAASALELPAGTIVATGTCIGDSLEICP